MNKRICLNKSVLDFMEHVLKQKVAPVVLEFGSGWSSAWFAERCDKLVTIETDPKWARLVKDDLNQSGFDNWQMIIGEIPSYQFVYYIGADLALIDCREDLRVAAMELAWLLLKIGGWILFDDAQRPQHCDAVFWLSKRAGMPTRLEWQLGDIESAKERLTLAWQK